MYSCLSHQWRFGLARCDALVLPWFAAYSISLRGASPIMRGGRVIVGISHRSWPIVFMVTPGDRPLLVPFTRAP